MAVYYIDYANGLDSDTGLDTGHPWKHCPGDPAYTGSGFLSSGDTAYFRRSKTYAGQINTQVGNVHYTVLPSWDSSGLATLDGNSKDRCILIHHDDIVISGYDINRYLKFTAATLNQSAVQAIGQATSGMKVEYCQFLNIGAGENNGIKFGGDAFAYTDFEIDYCLFNAIYDYAVKISGAGVHDGDIHHNDISSCGTFENTQVNISSWDTGGGIRDVAFHHNKVYDAATVDGNGINVNNADNQVYENEFYGNNTAIQCNPQTYPLNDGPILIYRNYIHGNRGFGIKVVENGTVALRFVRAYNNLLVNNGSVAEIKIEPGATYNEFFHNTIYTNSLIGFLLRNGCAYTVFKNNIIFMTPTTPTDALSLYSASLVTEDYNCLHSNATNRHLVYISDTDATYHEDTETPGLAEYRTATGQGVHSIWNNPLLVDPPTDLKLLSVSPAKDTGASDLGILTDFDGSVRPKDGYDIGAYEYAGGDPSEAPFSKDLAMILK
jgi:hypothetical protein